MSFRNCIEGKVKEGLITKSQSESLLKKQEELTKRYAETMGDEKAAAKAAADIVRVEELKLKQQKRNQINAAIAQKRIVDDLVKGVNQGVEFGKGVRNLLERAYVRKNSVIKQIYTGMDNFVDKFRSKFAGLTRDTEGMILVVRELLGESTGDIEAKQFADAVRNGFDIGHLRFKTSGGVIGKLDNYFPQIHTRELIKKASFEEWSEFLIDKLDTSKMIDFDTGLPFTREALLKQMKGDYDAVVTNGRSQLLDRAEKGLQTFGFGGDVSQRRMSSRFYQFKDADSFFAYNDRFGSGKDGLFDMVTNHVEAMARDIAILEVMGPRPNALMRHLELQMNARNSKFKGLTTGMYDVLTGYVDGVAGESWWFSALANIQNIMRSAYLGSASLSAISDVAFGSATAIINQLPATKVMSRYLELLLSLKGKGRQQAKQSGYIAGLAYGKAISESRFAGESMGGKVTSWLAAFTNRASGLAPMTKAMADAVSLESEGLLGNLVAAKTTWGRLSREFKDVLEAHDISKRDWDIISKTKLHEQPEGGKFLRTQELILTKGFDGAEKLATANKIDDWIQSMRLQSTNEPILKTKAIATGAVFGDARRGTALRALASSTLMFKSFPVTVMMQHLIPSLKSAGQGKLGHLGMVFVASTMLGGLVLQLRALRDGKDLRDFSNPKFWGAAALQGGGAGLFGDIFFSDYTRFGRDPLVDAFLGPTGGLASDVTRLFMGNFQRALEGDETFDKFKRDAFRIAKRNTPANNLWYSKLIVERFITDQFERLLDDQYDQRQRRIEKRMKKEFGQRYYWRKGETSPRRSPEIGELVA